MRLIFLTAMTAVFSVLLACANAVNDSNTTAAVTPAPAATAVPSSTSAPHVVDADRISLADAKKEFDAGTAVFVDVRDADAYNRTHIKGALNIPLAQLNEKADTLPKGKKIIVYCS